MKQTFAIAVIGCAMLCAGRPSESRHDGDGGFGRLVERLHESYLSYRPTAADTFSAAAGALRIWWPRSPVRC